MFGSATRLLPLLLAVALVAAAPLAEEGGGADGTATDEEAELLEPCDNLDELEVLTPEGLQSTIAAPTTPLWGIGTPGSAEQKDFLLDLAGQPVEEDSTFVTVDMSWDIPVEDYDLNLYDSSGVELDHSENIQPETEGESVAGTLSHCDRFTVESLNWSAAGLSTLTLDLGA